MGWVEVVEIIPQHKHTKSQSLEYNNYQEPLKKVWAVAKREPQEIEVLQWHLKQLQQCLKH